MNDLHRPIFVTGMGRSGTTLLRALIAAHPRVTIPTETHFLKNASVFGGLEQGRPSSFDAFWETYSRTVNFRNLGLDAQACRERIEQTGDTSYRGIFSAVLSTFREQAGVERIGEKTPNHVDHLETLLKWYPDAVVLIMRRDPRAVVSSQIQAPWVVERLRPSSLREGIVINTRAFQVGHWSSEWSRIYERVVPRWEEDPRTTVISYEDLVHDAEGELRRICAFIDEEYDPAMLDSRSESTVPVSALDAKNQTWEDWRRRHRSTYLGPVNSANTTKWKHDLTQKEIATIEGYCSHGMRAAGYGFENPPSVRLAFGLWLRVLTAAGVLEGLARSGALRAVHAIRQ